MLGIKQNTNLICPFSLVYKYGAVATGIYASDRGLSNINKGVFDQCSTTKINHAVTVVGYGTQSGKPYWLIKNSWGDNWGDGGYVKIVRGKTACGIAQNCALTECSKTGYASPAPQAPPPAPIPANQICDISKLYGNSNITGSYTLTTTGIYLKIYKIYRMTEKSVRLNQNVTTD